MPKDQKELIALLREAREVLMAQGSHSDLCFRLKRMQRRIVKGETNER
jgi:hypothetical protein